MGSRTAHADSVACPCHGDSTRPVVLLALADDKMRARFAYQLASSGFGVVTDIANLDAAKPDVIVAELVATRHDGTASITNISHDRRLRGIPVIAIADDVSDLTQTLAGQGGCAAVCLTTCSVTALTSGIHAVLNLRDG